MNIHYKYLRSLFFLLAILVIGCENPFNPDATTIDESSSFIPNTTVQQLLRNLEDAYSQKDLELYKYCLSDDFRFQLIASEVDDIGIDLDNDGILDEEWGFQQEIESHKNLFESGSSDGQYPPPDQIDLRFGGEPSIDDDYEVGHEGWKIVSTYFNLNLTFHDSSNISALGYARFYIKIVEEEWKIVIWRDESSLF